MKIKVLLADDNDAMRSAIRRTLQEEPRIHLVGEACSFGSVLIENRDAESGTFTPPRGRLPVAFWFRMA